MAGAKKRMSVAGKVLGAGAKKKAPSKKKEDGGDDDRADEKKGEGEIET